MRAYDFLMTVVPSRGEQIVLSIGGAVGAVFSFLLGGIDTALIWLIIFTVADYLTGLFAAWKLGELSAAKGREGLAKKAFVFVIVTICHGLDVVLGTTVLRDGAVIGYLTAEAISVAENADRIGWGNYIPAPLRKALASIEQEQEGEIKS